MSIGVILLTEQFALCLVEEYNNDMATVLKSIKQGLLYPIHYINGRRKSHMNLDSIAPGEGAVIDQNGQKVAVYKDESGTVSAHSAVCTHMGCIVDWDNGEKQWQCPCHGSQYDKNGKVTHGPAEKDLPDAQLS